MFRSKAFSVLQSIINKNAYNIKRTNSLPRILFSTDTLHRDSSGASIKASNVSLTKNLTKSLHQSAISHKTSQKFETPTAASPEILVNATVPITDDISCFTESEPDKLYSKLEIEIRGNNPDVLNSYEHFTFLAAKYLSLSYKCLNQRKCTHERFTLLKSVHVHKKHRVQYETRTYYKYFDLFQLTGSTADTYLEYIQRNLPEGVAMKVTRVELQTLPEAVEQAKNEENSESTDELASKNPQQER